MSSKKTSLNSNPLFRRQQRRHLSYPPDDHLYSKVKPYYSQNLDKDESENRATQKSQQKTRSKGGLNQTASTKHRNSLSGNISLAERLNNYRKETKKEKDKTVHRSGYEGKIQINKLIETIGEKLTNKPHQLIKFKSREEKPLRIATPERAKELVQRYFNNPNPKPIRKNQTRHYN